MDLDGIVAASPSVFIYRSDGKQVFLEEKAVSNPSLRHRAWLYKLFLQTIVSERRFDRSFIIGIDVDDGHTEWPSYLPIFGFQRPNGSSKPLLPDPDFLSSNFYQDAFWGLPDPTPFTAKRHQAIFVGSTTGGGQIDLARLEAKAVPRVEAARFFRAQSRRDVAFHLPAIVQCNPAAERMLISDGFGGPEISWTEQLQSKALISMDGNGATCSRVYVALASNSALMKYESKHELFYFSRLIRYKHYVPVTAHEQVYCILDEGAHGSRLLVDVAVAGKRFAEKHLSRQAVLDYSLDTLDYWTACTTACAALLSPKLPVTLPVRSP